MKNKVAFVILLIAIALLLAAFLYTALVLLPAIDKFPANSPAQIMANGMANVKAGAPWYVWAFVAAVGLTIWKALRGPDYKQRAKKDQPK